MQIIDVSGGSRGVRDEGRLRSAVEGMRQQISGRDVYKTVFEKAGFLTRGIICDHPFIDGNKRTGLVAALVFLNLNGCDTSSLDDQELEDFAVRVAVEKLEVVDIASWLAAQSCRTSKSE